LEAPLRAKPESGTLSAMAPPMADDPAGIEHEESRQELYGRGPSAGGLAAYEIIAIVLAVVGGAIAFEEIDHWSQWAVLGAIILTLIGFMAAVSPNRRGT
jgi:F0F1-type ATP synthase assembly protein I